MQSGGAETGRTGMGLTMTTGCHERQQEERDSNNQRDKEPV